MEGMGHSRRGFSLALVTAVGTIAFAALVVALTATGAMAAPEDQVDMLVEEAYNLTEVYQGEDTFFNVSLRNAGEAGYAPKEDPELEVFGYIDEGTKVSGHMTVNLPIYRRTNVTVNLKVNFPTVGNHTLRIVVDPSNRINESDEDNNELTINVTVLEATANRPPEADGGNDRVGYLNEPVLFSGRYSEDPDNDTLTYSWVFGDGGEGTGMVTNHTYLFEGQYGASLIVSDGQKVDIDTFTVTIIKAPVNHPPTATITIHTDKVYRGKELTLDGRASTDPDLDDLTYDWDFDSSDGVDDWVRGAQVTNKWSETGVYEVTLRVSDGKLTGTSTTLITVQEPLPPNEPPSASAGPDLTVKKGKEVEILGTGSDPDGHIVCWEWDLDNDGTYDTYSEVSGTLVTSFDEVGLHTLWLRVTDNRGDVETNSVIVTVEKEDGDGDESPGPGALAAVLALTVTFFIARQGFRGRPGGHTKNEKDELTIK
jgi:hypothetical protein